MRNPRLWIHIRNLIFLIQNVLKQIKDFAIHTITISSGPRAMQNGLKHEMFQTDFDVCVSFRCVRCCHHKMVLDLHNIHIYCMYRCKIFTYIYIYMWGNHLLSRFFWLVKCPKSSTKQILNGNCIILTLRAWQRSNSIVYQHKDRSFKSNQVKLLEMIWNARILHQNDIKWIEMIWNDMKGNERIWKDINRTEYLQRTLHQNDRTPFLDVARANTCNSIWPFLVCLRSGMAKKFKGSFWCGI